MMKHHYELNLTEKETRIIFLILLKHPYRRDVHKILEKIRAINSRIEEVKLIELPNQANP